MGDKRRKEERKKTDGIVPLVGDNTITSLAIKYPNPLNTTNPSSAFVEYAVKNERND